MKRRTAYGNLVKCRLIELNKTQKWLEESISEWTGLYMDRSYIGKILTGQYTPTKIVTAINEILGFADVGE